MAAAWNELPATGGLSECAALVRSAEALRVSAPELSVQLARRALLVGATDGSGTTTNAGEARTLSMRAHAVLAAGLVRINQHVNAVEPGFAALALAESGGASDVVVEVRLDLAACAQEVGEPLLGGALLRPVLEAGHAPPSIRAAALGRLVGCIAHVARRDDVDDALVEADRLLAADDGLSPDARRMERARLAVRTAAYHRWYGDTEDAVSAAREGLAQLDRLRRELRSESDRLRSRLVLELVCALLDEGELRDAESVAAQMVDEPVRATSAASVGQLMLAVATRVHLPAGQVDRGRSLLDQAAWLAERHRLDSLLADALTEVSRLDERAGRTSDALEALRGARAAEQRRLRAVARAARQVLTEVGAGQGAKDVTQQAVAALLRQLAHPAGVPVAMAPRPAQPSRQSTSSKHGATKDEQPDTKHATGPSSEEPNRPESRRPLPPPRTASEPVAGELTGSVDTDKGTGLLNREGLFRRLRSVRKGERPVALTLLRLEPNNDNQDAVDAGDRGPDTGIMAGLADKVRDMAPDNAELARSDGGELAVLLPHTTHDQAEEFAATIRETAIESDWLADASGKDMSISTGVVQSSPSEPGDDTQVDAAGMLTAARHALTPAQATTSATSLADTASALKTALAEETPTKPGPTPTAAAAAMSAAMSEETPTTPLNVTSASQSLTVGRSVLSSLSIPSGSGGRRRAGGEPPPGSKTRWPSEQAEAPRWTRAERRAQESTPTPASGWPTEPDISQPLRHPATAAQQPPNPDTDPSPPLAETPQAAELTAFGAESPGEPPTTAKAPDATAEARSAYEQTRAELARMMTALNAGTAKPPAADPTEDRRNGAPHQSIPTPPDPDEMPEPPRRRPDIPDPTEPDPIPPAPPEPGPTPPAEPGPLPIGETTRSGLMAAFEALTGPLPTPDPEPAEASATDAPPNATSAKEAVYGTPAAWRPATNTSAETSATHPPRPTSSTEEPSPTTTGTPTTAKDTSTTTDRHPGTAADTTPATNSALAPRHRPATESHAAAGPSGTTDWRSEITAATAGPAVPSDQQSTTEPATTDTADSSAMTGWRQATEADATASSAALSGRRSAAEDASADGAGTSGPTGWRSGTEADAAGAGLPSRRRSVADVLAADDTGSGGPTDEVDATAGSGVLSGRRRAAEDASADTADSSAMTGWRSGTEADATAASSGLRSAAEDALADGAGSSGAVGWRQGTNVDAAAGAGLPSRRRSAADALAADDTGSGGPTGDADATVSSAASSGLRSAAEDASADGAGFGGAAGWRSGTDVDAAARVGLPSGRRSADDADSGGTAGWRSETTADAAAGSALPSGRRSGAEAVTADDAGLNETSTWPGTDAASAGGAGLPRRRSGAEADAGSFSTSGRRAGTGTNAAGDAGFGATLGWQPGTATDGGLTSGRRRAPDTDAAAAGVTSSAPGVDSTAHQRLDGGSTPPSQQAEPLPSRLGSGEAASDAEPSSDQPFQASFEAAPQLRSRKPLTSWAELESSSVVESPADDLFGLEPAEKRPPRAPFKSALGAAFAAFGEPEPALDAEGSVTPADPNKPTYDEPIGPPTRPHDMPRRDRSDSTTIAGLLAEALAAYQSSTEGDDDEDDDDEEQRQAPEPLDRFDSFLNDSRQSGFSGRHRSPE